MSRREEVEDRIMSVKLSSCWTESSMEDLARTLADEVDALRGQLPVDWKEKGPRCSHLNCCAEAYCSSDIITKLLELLEPGLIPLPYDVRGKNYWIESVKHDVLDELHARACEIAGRKE